MLRSKITLFAGLAAALALTASCGDSGTSSEGSGTTSAPAQAGNTQTPTSEQTSGSADSATPTSTGGDAEAFCGPLDTKTRLKAVIGARGEFAAPMLLADHFGYFKDLNLDFSVEITPALAATPLLARGDIDMIESGYTAAWFNMRNQGIDFTWVMSNFQQGTVDKQGLWVRRSFFSDPQNPDFKELAKGVKIGNNGPLAGGPVDYSLNLILQKYGVDLTELTLTNVPITEMLVALKNGAIDGAWVFDPAWLELEKSGDYVFVGGQPEKEPLGAVIFGPTLTGENRRVGMAVVLGMVKAQKELLTGDYHSDEKVVAALSEVLNTEAATIQALPSMSFNYNVNKDTVENLQNYYKSLPGEVLTGKILTDSEVVDRSYVENAEKCLAKS